MYLAKGEKRLAPKTQENDTDSAICKTPNKMEKIRNLTAFIILNLV